MFCENCGEKMPDDSKFCSACGTKVISVSTPADETPLIQQSSIEKPLQTELSANLKGLAVGLKEAAESGKGVAQEKLKNIQESLNKAGDAEVGENANVTDKAKAFLGKNFSEKNPKRKRNLIISGVAVLLLLIVVFDIFGNSKSIIGTWEHMGSGVAYTETFTRDGKMIHSEQIIGGSTTVRSYSIKGNKITYEGFLSFGGYVNVYTENYSIDGDILTIGDNQYQRVK